MTVRPSEPRWPRHEADKEDPGFEHVSLPIRRLIEKVSARRLARLAGDEADDDKL